MLPPVSTLSIQLWSTRGPDPLDDQLHFLSDTGFRDVQPFHDQYQDVMGMRALLDKYQLTAATGHFNLSMFAGDARPVIDAAQALGMELVVAPWIDADIRPRDVAGWQALHQRLSEIKQRVGDQGLRFAWHNHDFEFVRLEDGSWAMDHLLGDDIDLAMDLAWVFRAGEDPADWLRKYRGRVPVIHIKDVAPAGENLDEMGFADVGKGIMNWPLLYRAAIAAGAGLIIAEHDAPSDWRRFATRSAAAIRALSEATD